MPLLYTHILKKVVVCKHMSCMFKKIATPLVLLSFLTIAFFSFASMTYSSDGGMRSSCLFSAMGTSLCPQSALPGAIHHISAYQSFLNVPVNSGMTARTIILLIIVSVALAFSFHTLLFRPLAPISYNSPPFTSHNRKIKRWLSLFENSPPHY